MLQRFSGCRSVLIPLTLLVGGCSQDMQEQPSVQAQEPPPIHSPSRSVPLHPREGLLLPTVTPGGLQRGRWLFSINCAHCHGPTGDGDGPVAGFLKKMPANLHAPFVQRKSAQELFDIVTSGQEIMPAFRGELSAAERWSLVTFIQSFGTSEGRLSATHQSEEDP